MENFLFFLVTVLHPDVVGIINEYVKPYTPLDGDNKCCVCNNKHATDNSKCYKDALYVIEHPKQIPRFSFLRYELPPRCTMKLNLFLNHIKRLRNNNYVAARKWFSIHGGRAQNLFFMLVFIDTLALNRDIPTHLLGKHHKEMYDFALHKSGILKKLSEYLEMVLSCVEQLLEYGDSLQKELDNAAHEISKTNPNRGNTMEFFSRGCFLKSKVPEIPNSRKAGDVKSLQPVLKKLKECIFMDSTETWVFLHEKARKIIQELGIVIP